MGGKARRDLIDFGVYAQDHGGLEKPDPRIFHIAVEQAGCSPEEIVHVGDSLEKDVAGARTAGLHAVWLNRNGSTSDRPADVEYEITSLAELGQLPNLSLEGED